MVKKKKNKEVMKQDHIKEKEQVLDNRIPKSRENTRMKMKKMIKKKTIMIEKMRKKNHKRISLQTFIISLKKVVNK